jgi:hypothetical protein
VYVPAVDTTIDCVVAPVDQTLPVAADEVNVIVLPGQNDEGPLIVGVGGTGAALSVTTYGADVAVQPLASVTVTVYVPPAVTVIDCVVAPVDQRFPLTAEDVSVMLLPGTTEEGPLMTGVATPFAVTTFAADVAVPNALLTVTVYEPGAVIVIDCVVAPVDQRLPLTDDEVSVIVLVVQNAVAPLIVGTGAAIPRPFSFALMIIDAAAA